MNIGKIIENSPAERCGHIKVGDHIVAVNNIDIRNMEHAEIVNIINTSKNVIKLTICEPVVDTIPNIKNELINMEPSFKPNYKPEVILTPLPQKISHSTQPISVTHVVANRPAVNYDTHAFKVTTINILTNSFLFIFIFNDLNENYSKFYFRSHYCT